MFVKRVEVFFTMPVVSSVISDVRKAVAEYRKDSVAGLQVLAGSRIVLYKINLRHL